MDLIIIQTAWLHDFCSSMQFVCLLPELDFYSDGVSDHEAFVSKLLMDTCLNSSNGLGALAACFLF